MILQTVVTPYANIPAIVKVWFEPICFWAAVVLCLTISMIVLNHYRKAEAGKQFLMGIFIFSFFFGIALICDILRLPFTSDRMDIVEGWIGKGSIISGSELYWRIGYYIFSWLAIANFYYITEKNIFQRKTKYIFMYSAVGEGIVSIALYFTTSTTHFVLQIFATIGFFLCGVAPIILYLVIAIKSTGIIRKSSFLATFGLLFLVLGVLCLLPESQYVVWTVTGQLLDAWFVAVVGPLCLLTGLILLLYGYIKMFSLF